MHAFCKGLKVPAKLYWDSSYEKILEAQSTLTDLHVQYWLHHSFPKWTWWFLWFWTIFPLFIWWKYTNRDRFLEICFYGVMISISAGILDTIGVAYDLWCYPYDLMPGLPNFFPIDYVTLPVVFMLVYQKYTGWKQYIIATAIFTSVLSFVFDPIMVWMNIYQPLAWQYYYSPPVFVFMAIFVKWVTIIVTGQDRKYGGIASGKKQPES